MFKDCPRCKNEQIEDARYCNYCAYAFTDPSRDVLTKEENAPTSHQLFKIAGVAAIVILLFTLVGAFIGGSRKTDDAPLAASLPKTNLPPDAQYIPINEPLVDGVIEGKVVGVSDGDTITVLDKNNKEHKIRFGGIDAPESKQDFGNKAKENLSNLVYGKTVRVISNKIDKYGRTVGTVFLDGKDINLEQIKAGFAWHYKDYASEQSEADRTTYADAETVAKRSKSGLWSMANPTAPWAFRKGADVPAADADKIFGNKNSLIYHWVGCPGFAKIGEKNRVVFAAPTEAEAAGYRAAKNCTSPKPNPSPSPEPEAETLEANLETEKETTYSYTVPAPVYTPTPAIVSRQPTPAPEIYVPRPLPPPAPPYNRETTIPSATATALCNDGTVSYSANRQGTCSHHGGVDKWLDGSTTSDEPTSTYTPRYPSSDTSDRPKTVQVDGYYRKDGTYVRPHTRSAPRRRN